MNAEQVGIIRKILAEISETYKLLLLDKTLTGVAELAKPESILLFLETRWGIESEVPHRTGDLSQPCTFNRRTRSRP